MLFNFSSLLFVLVSCLVIWQPTEEWKLRKEKKGIRVYTKKIDDSKYDEYKVIASVEGTIERFYSMFKDFDHYSDLFKDTKELKIHFDSPERHVIYLRNKVPFPAKDRDAVMENRIRYDDNNKSLHVDIKCIDDFYVPQKKVIQIENCQGSWLVEKLDETHVKVTHQFLADPGGSIPAFIVNIKTVQNPLKTLAAVRERIAMPRYNDKSLFLSLVQKTSK